MEPRAGVFRDLPLSGQSPEIESSVLNVIGLFRFDDREQRRGLIDAADLIRIVAAGFQKFIDDVVVRLLSSCLLHLRDTWCEEPHPAPGHKFLRLPFEEVVAAGVNPLRFRTPAIRGSRLECQARSDLVNRLYGDIAMCARCCGCIRIQNHGDINIRSSTNPTGDMPLALFSLQIKLSLATSRILAQTLRY